MTGREVDADDPFAGYGPQPVHCRWLSVDDERQFPAAAVVRLLVDDQRRSDGWANAVYQRDIVLDVATHLGSTSAVVVTPAGMVAARPIVALGLGAVDAALAGLTYGPNPPPLILGCDLVARPATPWQSVVYLPPGVRQVADNTAVKLHPAGGEESSLWGWLQVRAAGGVPVELRGGRRLDTPAGLITPLVCHESVLFSGRSRANLTDSAKTSVREFLIAGLGGEPRSAFALIATHWQDRRTGARVAEAARNLANEFGVTAVTTFFGPRDQLPELAATFPICGPRKTEVVTLLVEDTFGTLQVRPLGERA